MPSTQQKPWNNYEVYPGLIPGLLALGLTYTYAEQRIGFIGNRPLPKLPEEIWVLNALVAVNVIGCSGASPNSLKGMSAKHISDLYGLLHDETEGLRILLQKTKKHSGRWSRMYYFLDCVLGRQQHCARIRREQRTPISKVPVLLLADTPIFLGLFVIDRGIGYLVANLGLPVSQTWLLAIALLILPFYLIRPAVRFLIRTPFGLTMKYWYHRVH
ncbi:hypothetical protein HAP94_09825 [Acidithiobacillus ferrivorans]|nr:hypothetical protein [Acidithiobacillus ferrivorans]